MRLTVILLSGNIPSFACTSITYTSAQQAGVAEGRRAYSAEDKKRWARRRASTAGGTSQSRQAGTRRARSSWVLGCRFQLAGRHSCSKMRGGWARRPASTAGGRSQSRQAGTRRARSSWVLGFSFQLAGRHKVLR